MIYRGSIFQKSTDFGIVRCPVAHGKKWSRTFHKSFFVWEKPERLAEAGLVTLLPYHDVPFFPRTAGNALMGCAKNERPHSFSPGVWVVLERLL